MSDNDMFEEEKNVTKPEQVETPPAPPSDPFADKLQAITNENGEPKYKDVETALEALKASQQFIETLKTEKSQTSAELEQARAELEKMGNIDDFVNRIKPDAKTQEKVETPPKTHSLSEEEITELLQKQLDQRDQQSQQARNLEEVTRKLSEMHGDKSAEYIKQRAKELGTTAAELKNLSMANPNMALALLGTPGKTVPKPSQPSTLNLPPNTNEDNPRPKWDRGAARGGLTSAELAERWRQSKDFTNKRIGLEN